jgi:hypothetical protein
LLLKSLIADFSSNQILKNKAMSKKAELAQKIKEANPNFTEEQSIQVANFLMSLSEVYYDNSTKSNLKNQAA